MKKKLKIAQIAPFWYQIPPRNYGGTERVVSYITEELVRRGHKVTLFALSGSKTKAKLVSPISSNYVKQIKRYLDPTFNCINSYVNSEVFKRADEFDIIHSHAYFFAFYFCDFVKTPVIHTLHNQLPREREAENEIMRKYKKLNFISISNEYRDHFDLNYIATVYHGLKLKYFPFNKKGGKNLFWIGRIAKNKGEIEAIKVAEKTRKKIEMLMSVQASTKDYYEKEIKPLSAKNVIPHYKISFFNTHKYYGNSKLFLFPLRWKEPFGLVITESMACGTPVVAYARGSIPELIKDGETGFIINPSSKERKKGNWIIKKTGFEGLCEAVERIYGLTEGEYLNMRKACRKHIEQNFTVEKMVDSYEKVYYDVIQKLT